MTDELPEGVERAAAVYACFFGDWSLAGIQRHYERIAGCTHLVVTTAIHEAHEPAALITAFV